jgi:hypothetical protein
MVEVASNDIMFITNFVKTGQVVQRLEEEDTRLHGDLISKNITSEW